MVLLNLIWGSPRAPHVILTATFQSLLISFTTNLYILISGHGYKLKHRVTEEDNKLSVGEPFLGGPPAALTDVDLYTVEKELYLASKCQVDEPGRNPWHFWMVMLKNGNMDTFSGLCPKDGHKVGPFPPESRFPCFGRGCMNQPLLFHNYTSLEEDNTTLRGSFYGTYDLDADLSKGFDHISYYSVTWEKEVGKGNWVFHHVVKTSDKYPWLMLYLRSDATKGVSGGYHHQTRGMTRIVSSFLTFESLRLPSFRYLFVQREDFLLCSSLLCRLMLPKEGGILHSCPSHKKSKPYLWRKISLFFISFLQGKYVFPNNETVAAPARKIITIFFSSEESSHTHAS